MDKNTLIFPSFHPLRILFPSLINPTQLHSRFGTYILNNSYLFFAFQYPNIIQRTSSKHIRIISRKLNIIYTFIVTSVSQLRVQVFRFYPVDVALTGAAEEMGEVTGKGD